MISVKNQLGKPLAFRQFQADCDLHAIMEIHSKDSTFAVFLLCDAKGKWFASIPFNFGGIHPELYDESVVSTVDSITTFADYLIPGERITFYGGKRTHARNRNQYLYELRQKSRSRLPINALLTEAERQRMLEVTQKGLRQEWEQKIFCTWHQSRASTRQFDRLGNIINGLARFWQGVSRTFTGTKDYYQRLTYARLAEDITKTGFTPSFMLLKHRGNLNVFSLDGLSAWEWLWYRFNPANSTPPPIPQLIKVTENQLGQFETEVIRHSQNDILSVLLAGSYGKSRSSLPVVHRRDSVFFNGHHIAAMSLDGGIKQEGKPRAYGTLRTQLRYMFDHLCAPGVKDTEFWVELEPANKTQVRDDLNNTTKQSSASNKYAAQKGEVVNVEATLQQSESLEAQKLLAKGRQPSSVGFTALVYRKNLSELDRACQQLAHHFGSVKLLREEQVCWKRWLETLPITTARILTSTCEGVLSFDPRLIFPSSEIPGLLPLSLPQPLEKSPTGLEFLCNSQPIYVDLSKNVQNALICGTKGSGKSNVTFPFIRHALNYGPVLGMDMSLGGDSTFKLVCDLYGERAAYYDLITTRNNAILYPDLRALPLSEREKRFGFWKTDTIEFLVALSLGTLNDPFLEQRVRTLVQKAFDAFLAEPSIQRRYELALDGGHGTNAWFNQPILKDFVPYCTVERLGLFDADELDKRSLHQIRTMFEAKLNDPNIGKVIGYPTEVSTDADLIFFSLAGLNDPSNALIMALIAQKLCFTLGLSHERSLLAIDECSTILRSSPAFARLIGQRFAIGRKFGQSSLLVGQDLDSVLRTETASQILDNLDITLIGLINAQAAFTYHSKLNIPRRLINQNTSPKYQIWKEEMISHWLLGHNHIFWQVDYASSLLELATLANQPDEKKLKQQYFSSNPTPSEVIDFSQVYADKFLKQVS